MRQRTSSKDKMKFGSMLKRMKENAELYSAPPNPPDHWGGISTNSSLHFFMQSCFLFVEIPTPRMRLHSLCLVLLLRGCLWWILTLRSSWRLHRSVRIIQDNNKKKTEGQNAFTDNKHHMIPFFLSNAKGV